MKILFLSEKFPPDNLGGAEMVAYRLAKELQRGGQQLSVLTITADRAKEGELFYQGIKVIWLFSHYPKFLRNYLSLHNFFITKKLKKVLVKIKPDIVHAQLINWQISYYVLKLAKKMGAKVFLTAHDVSLFNDGKLVNFKKNEAGLPVALKYKVSEWDLLKRTKLTFNPFRNLIIKKYLKYVDKIFAVSEELKKALAANGIINVETVYNGIDLDEFKVSDTAVNEFVSKFQMAGKKVIFFGGRISISKGAGLVAPILKKVVAKAPNAVLLVAGVKNNATQLIEQQAREQGIAKNVVCTGWLSGDELKAAYQCSAVCITPSVCFDTFNLTNIEAMAFGTPVVGTIFGGTSEIVEDGKTGYIVNPFDTDDFAEKIIDLLTDENKRRQFGQAGRERVQENFSIKKQADLMLVQYFK